MDERKRLAVALAIPALVLAAMLFAPLGGAGRLDAAVEPTSGPLDASVPRASESPDLGPRRSTAAPAATVESNDWADILQLNGITYSAGLLNSGRALREDDLGSEIARVSARLNGNVRPQAYVLKHGDAAYLDPGTPLYATNGYRATFRVAARREGRLVLFEAVVNPNARSGRDLLDIEGRVASISMDTKDPRAVSRSIDRPDDVTRLVRMLLEARVDPAVAFGRRTTYVSFRLFDGTATTFQFAEETRNLSRGITGLPLEFGTAIASRP
jgi:hypothetical protein